MNPATRNTLYGALVPVSFVGAMQLLYSYTSDGVWDAPVPVRGGTANTLYGLTFAQVWWFGLVLAAVGLVGIAFVATRPLPHPIEPRDPPDR